MKKLIILVGRSCSGKTTLAEKMKKEANVNEALSFTTRPIRKTETDGIQYKFLTLKEVETLKNNNKLVEFTKYHHHYYGILKDSFDFSRHNVAVVEPHGAEQLRKNLKDDFAIVTVLLDASDEVILERSLLRGDDPLLFKKRFKKDKELFAKDKVYHDLYIKYPDELDYQKLLTDK